MAPDVQLVIFRLANEDYGLPIQKVQEINRMVSISRLPQAPDFIEGIINLRGRVIPVVDLRKRFGLKDESRNDDTRIMIVDISGQTVGIIVDAVNEVVRMSASSIEPPPPSFILESQYIDGIGKLEERLIILLNIDRILTSRESIQLKEAGQ